MILLSILIHFLGNHLPKFIFSKERQNNPTLKLSGLCIDFLVAFFIFFLVNLFSPKANYISNEDAIYGLEFNKTMQQLGFENGDKIISINNKSIKNTDKN